MEGAGPGREDGHSDGEKGIAVCYQHEITRARSSLRNAEQMEMSCLGQFCKCPHSADHGCGAGKDLPGPGWDSCLLTLSEPSFACL